MNFCGGCGAAHVPGAQFCPQCGRAYSLDAAPTSATGFEATAAPVGSSDEPFPSWAGVAAGAAVVTMPFISLIAALVMRSSEQRESRRAFLKNWAIASGAWLGLGLLIVIIVFASVASKSGVLGGGCKGGPDPYGLPSYRSTDGTHWIAIVPCVNGGTKTRPANKSETRFLNKH